LNLQATYIVAPPPLAERGVSPQVGASAPAEIPGADWSLERIKACSPG
jgi:hypothetical protein